MSIEDNRELLRIKDNTEDCRKVEKYSRTQQK
jgi:hypothetical protein